MLTSPATNPASKPATDPEADTVVHLRCTPDTVRWGRLPTADEAFVAQIASGDAFTVDTVSHEGLLPDQGADAVEFFGRWGIEPDDVLPDVQDLKGTSRVISGDAGPHVVLGPIELAGARPGDVVCVEPLSLRPRATYGIVSNRHQRGPLAGELPRAGEDGEPTRVVSTLARVTPDGRGRMEAPNGAALTFPLNPFLGLVGVTPAASEPLSSTPPGPFGGNLDIRHLQVGSRLFLPVQVDGAGLHLGDPHYAQGNGEVALTAFEAPLRAVLRATLLSGGEAAQLAELLRMPWGETRTHTILVGLGDTLDQALTACARNAVAFLVATTGVDEQTALAFLSAAADFEISQAVNYVVGVHCLIRHADLRAA